MHLGFVPSLTVMNITEQILQPVDSNLHILTNVDTVYILLVFFIISSVGLRLSCFHSIVCRLLKIPPLVLHALVIIIVPLLNGNGSIYY